MTMFLASTSKEKGSQTASLPLQQQEEHTAAEEEGVDCPICLDVMNQADLLHPLQCTQRCGYNFCLSCIQSLITSSKDDYLEASDGNRHVKVSLHCPNCRSDLGTTICDTVLLRRADTVKMLMEQENYSEEQLSPSQIRMREAMNDFDVMLALDEARKSEAKFLLQQFGGIKEEKKETDGSDSGEGFEEDEGWGVEADLTNGVHNSFVAPRGYKIDTTGWESAEPQKKWIDSSLFAGLDFFMTHAEKLLVTKLMTSGDTSPLAQAAEIMRNVEDYCNRGITPAKRASKRRGSVYILVNDAIKAHEEGNGHHRKPPPVSPGIVTASEHRRANRELRKQREFMRLHPLPVRMPKFVELELCDPSSGQFPLTFCDDIWNGTVLDAYCKITIDSRGNKITKKETENKGVFNVLSGGKFGKHFGEVRIGEERARVLVASVRGDAGKQGVMKGDVVTHFNGEAFTGNSDDLLAAIRACLDCSDSEDSEAPTFQMVLNAEPAIAEVLRRRALLVTGV